MMCSYTGYLDTVPPFSIVDIDWSNALSFWAAATPMDTEERLLVQAAMIKAGGGGSKVMIYRNSVYGYPWFTSVRFILDDPAYRPWFIKFSGRPPYFSPPCDDNYDPPLCTDLFHTQMDTPNIPGKNGYGNCAPPACNCGSQPCGFYVFNHSSSIVVHGQTFQQWFIHSYVLNAAGLSPDVDGFFFDDFWTESGDMGDNTVNATVDMGLTPADLVSLTTSYRANMAALTTSTLAAERFAWTMFWNSDETNGNAEFAPLVLKETCAADLRSLCNASSPVQSRAALFGLSEPMGTFGGPSLRSDLANFLLVRGDYAFFGVGWLGCSSGGAQDWRIPSALNVDVGLPGGLCVETQPGVFVREFSKSIVTTDCNAWQSSICPHGGGPCLSDFVSPATYFVKISDTLWDHALCADTGRPCSVYSQDYGYVAEFAEGACVSPGWVAQEGEEPLVNISDYWSQGGFDNMAAVTGSPPVDGQTWVNIDLECLAYANDGPGRWALEIWRSAERSDYWTLASPASRANATAENYTLVSRIGFVLAAPPGGRAGSPARTADGALWGGEASRPPVGAGR